MSLCEKCEKRTNDVFISVFDEPLCEDCWDDYLMTDRGKLEYFIGIAKGDLPISDYDADFLGHVVTCWNKYKEELNYFKAIIESIETKAKNIGLL